MAILCWAAKNSLRGTHMNLLVLSSSDMYLYIRPLPTSVHTCTCAFALLHVIYNQFFTRRGLIDFNGVQGVTKVYCTLHAVR